jgi:hypothetical protein
VRTCSPSWITPSALTLVLLLAVHGSSEDERAGQPLRKVDGRAHPELLPEHVLWRGGFAVLANAARAGGQEIKPELLQALADYTLRLPVADVRTLVEVADRARSESRRLEEPLGREHAGGPQLDWSPERRRRHRQQIDAVFTSAGEELSRRLPPASFSAVRRWLTRSIAPGTIAWIGPDDVPNSFAKERE